MKGSKKGDYPAMSELGVAKGRLTALLLEYVHTVARQGRIVGNGELMWEMWRLIRLGKVDLRRSVHRRVYEREVGPIPPGFEVHHRDTNPLNNHPRNLQCVTPAEHREIHEQLRLLKR